MELSRNFIITNRSINAMLKPNNKTDYTISSGPNSDVGIQVLNGRINHHVATVFDIVYDHMYRMFNESNDSEYINSSLTKILASHDGMRHDFFTKLLSDKKLDFYRKVIDIGTYATSLGKDGVVSFSKATRDFLLNECPHVIDYAFPADFSIPYRAELENNCEKEGNFNKVIKLLNLFKFEASFFKYILNGIFYGKLPSWNNYNLSIDLNNIFENGERTTYVLKNWFQEVNDLTLNISYPITCFSHHYEGDLKFLPKKLFLKTYIFALPNIKPFNIETGKSKMDISVSLLNKFMVFYAHDAKLCVRTYIPSELYSMSGNAFFIGKAILNNSYYSKTAGGYVNRKKYTLSEMFEYLNLPEKDDSSRNNIHRKKAIFRALDQLDASGIIKIGKTTSERILLDWVWSISERSAPKPMSNVIPMDDCNEDIKQKNRSGKI